MTNHVKLLDAATEAAVGAACKIADQRQTVHFGLVLSSGLDTGEAVTVELQYTVDGGTTWITFDSWVWTYAGGDTAATGHKVVKSGERGWDTVRAKLTSITANDETVTVWASYANPNDAG